MRPDRHPETRHGTALTVRAGVFAVLASTLVMACGDAAARGQQLYSRQGCAVCHGPGGRGDGPSVKRLDVPPRDLTDPRAYRHGSGEDQIAAAIRTGIGAMPPYRDLSEEDARAIAAWLVTQQRGR